MAVTLLKTLHPIRRSLRPAAVAAVVVAALLGQHNTVSSQERAGQERTRISGAELREALRRTSRGNPLSNVIVAGDELQSLIQEGAFDIRLDNAQIEGGLAFEGHPDVTIALEVTNSEIAAQAISRRLSAGTSLYIRHTTFREPVDLSGTIFRGPVDAAQATFVKTVRFPGTTFQDHARFDGARFQGNALFQHMSAQRLLTFEGATFGARAAFSNAKLAAVDFDKARFVATANFGGALFNEEATFSGTVFEGIARFSGAGFNKPQIFDSAFRGRPRFEHTSFSGNVEFRSIEDDGRSQFLSGVTFLGTVVDGYMVFNSLDVKGDLLFLGVTVAGGLQAAYSKIEGAFMVSESLIGGPTNFDGTHFQDRANFARTAFEAEVTFGTTRFEMSPVFNEACFAGRVALQNSDLGPYVDFRGAEIGHLDLNSSLEPTIYRSRFDLRRARIVRATFNDVIFTNNLDLSDGTFGEPELICGIMVEPLKIEPGLDLRFVTFEDQVTAQRANFGARLTMFGTKFERGVDFTNARFPELGPDKEAKFSLAFVDFGDLRLRWHQLPDPRFWTPADDSFVATGTDAERPATTEPISRTLAGLEGMFRSRKQLADTNSATYHRKRAELREARQIGWTSDRIEKELEWLVWGLTCGYGTKIWWIVGWALLLNLLFTLIYWRWADVDRKPHPDLERDFSLRLRLLDLPQHYRVFESADRTEPAEARKLVDALRVSSVILLKIGYRDTTLSGRVGRIDVNAVVRLEWFLGFLVLAAFTVTLSNTQPLINRLISGVL